MFEIVISSISKSFGHQPVLDNIGFEIRDDERIGLIGQNGTGKSTLLNIIYGLETPDAGEIIGLENKTVGYLTQHSKLNPDKTLIEIATQPTGQLGSLAKRISYLEGRLEESAGMEPEAVEQLSGDYAKALEDFAASGGYGHPAKAEKALETLGFTKRHFQTKIGQLSGGERTKARLVNLILEAEDADLLLMDEPTNHLDIETTEWLENYLLEFPAPMLIVSHDRYLLDKLATKTVEIEARRSTVYSGNYSQFIEKKAFEFETNKARYRKQQKEIQRQKEMIQFMHQIYHYNTIHKTQQKKLDRMKKMDRPIDHARKLDVDFGKAEKSGKDTIDAHGVVKEFGDVAIIGKCDFRIEKGDKIGLIGQNGSGKTTLIRMIMGELEPTRGEIKVSKGVTAGYYDQDQDGLVRGNTVLQEIRKEKKDASEEWTRNFLAKFFFRGGDVYKKVFTLSGGERARLAIAKLLLSQHNLLILDEPSNYLDLYAKASVESALRDYEGTLIVISHDRQLLDNVVDNIFELKDGKLTTYAGNYSDYRRQKGRASLPTGGELYEVTKKFKDWKQRKTYQAGEKVRIRDGDLDNYQWAIENGYLKKK